MRLITCRRVRRMLSDHSPDAAARIWYITGAPGDDVNVSVIHGLPGVQPVVEANVETVRAKSLDQLRSHFADKVPHGSLIGTAQLVYCRHVPPRKYQGVAFGMPRLYHCARLQRPGFFCWSI